MAVGYRIQISEEEHRHDKALRRENKRVTTGRLFLLVFSILLVVAGTTTFLGWVANFIWVDLTVPGILVGIVVGLLTLSGLLPRYFLITNPQLVGLVTQDMFTGHRIPYGPGLHVSYPWEERTANGNVPLNIITQRFEEKVPTKTGQAVVTFALQYAADIRHITNFVGIDESTIQEGFAALIRSFISNELSKVTVEGARKMIDPLNEKLEKDFMGLETEVGGRKVTTTQFEENYGIVTVVLTIEGIDFPENIQKTRDAQDEAEQLLKVAAKLSGLSVTELKKQRKEGVIDDETWHRLIDDGMAASGNATKEIKVFHGLRGVGTGVLVDSGGEKGGGL